MVFFTVHLYSHNINKIMECIQTWLVIDFSFYAFHYKPNVHWPVFLLLLNLPGIILVFKAFLPNKSIPKKEKRNLKIISLAGIACLSFLIAITVNIRRERTDMAILNE
jgi:hypothetical protein